MTQRKRKGPTFRVGQVVVDKVEYLPRRIIAYRNGWYEIEPACGMILEGHRMDPKDLRPLTRREGGTHGR